MISPINGYPVSVKLLKQYLEAVVLCLIHCDIDRTGVDQPRLVVTAAVQKDVLPTRVAVVVAVHLKHSLHHVTPGPVWL